MTTTPATNRKRFTPIGIIFTLGGVVLFAYFVKQAGVSQIVDGIRRLGAGFVLILIISAVRHVVRSIAWMMCVEAPHRLRFRDALRARLMGDAIGNILPFASFFIYLMRRAKLGPGEGENSGDAGPYVLRTAGPVLHASEPRFVASNPAQKGTTRW